MHNPAHGPLPILSLSHLLFLSLSLTAYLCCLMYPRSIIAAERPVASSTPTATAAMSAMVLHWHLDRAAVHSWIACEPFAVLRDPRAATVAAHVERQLRLMDAMSNSIPYASLLFDGTWASFDGGINTPTHHYEGRNMRFASDAGPSIALVENSIRKILSRDRGATTAANAHGFYGERFDRNFEGTAFIGKQGNAMMAAILGTEMRPWHRPDSNEAKLVFNGRILLETKWAALDDDAIKGVIASWGESLTGLVPSMEVRVAPRDGEIASTISLRGLGTFTCGVITPQTATRIPADAQCAVALAIPLKSLPLIHGIFASLAPTQSHHKTMLDISKVLSTALDGQIVLHGSWNATQLPEATLMLGMKDAPSSAQVGTMLGNILPELGGKDLTIAGADRAWSLTIGDTIPVFLGLNSKRLIIATDALKVTQGLSETPLAQSASIPEQTGLWMRVDCQSLARTWLPLAWAELKQGSIPLIYEHSYRVRGLLNNLAADTTKQPADIWTLLIQNAKNPPKWRTDIISEYFGDRSVVEAGVSLWSPISPPSDNTYSNANRTILITRTATASWRIFDSESDTTNDERQLLTTLAGRTKIAGLHPHDLRIIPSKEIPTFDRNWLPPESAIISHLRPWTMSVRSTSTGSLVIEERGLPVMAAIGAVGSHMGWFMNSFSEQRDHKNRRIAAFDRMAQTRPKLIRAIESLGNSMQLAFNDHDRFPEKPSLLPNLDLAAYAVFFGDGSMVPTLSDIDRLGIWNLSAKEQDPVWLIRLNDHYAVSFFRNDYEVIDAPSDLPVPPTLTP